ncbi:unnamed protein product [Ceutorhynchus assimilis]|uniref:Uncharacterized protein n=1 Tax=Ceutorhynchus assimilis TaxID=467358 RepID=A0A9N9MDJ7_9CUCU|nr:unnamed protein product [Ceutorhynchus assimilis]
MAAEIVLDQRRQEEMENRVKNAGAVEKVIHPHASTGRTNVVNVKKWVNWPRFSAYIVRYVPQPQVEPASPSSPCNSSHPSLAEPPSCCDCTLYNDLCNYCKYKLNLLDEQGPMESTADESNISVHSESFESCDEDSTMNLNKNKNLTGSDSHVKKKLLSNNDDHGHHNDSVPSKEIKRKRIVPNKLKDFIL